MKPAAAYDAIVLGAGAAGLMAAAVAGRRGRKVLLLDHTDEPGRKILISGGGRCNFTNRTAPPDRFHSTNPHFATSALARYTPADFIMLVERHGIAWHEKTLGQLFCDGSARQIVAMLMADCAAGGVESAFGQPVAVLDHADGRFSIACGHLRASAPAVILATGGLSIPKLGATGFSYDVARRFRLEVVPPRPALVPLTLGPGDALFRSLSGVAAEVVARCGRVGFREAALFTHKGLSGPAILQVSSYWHPGEPVVIDFFPGRAPGWLVAARRERPRARLRHILATGLASRLAEALADRLDLSVDLGNVPDRSLAAVEERLAAWAFVPTGTEGYAKAEVTAGGISTAELSSRTMAVKKITGLYAIGEAVDVTGWLGGYNFQWAWSSAVAAGEAV